jgi:hypothetical protein
LDTLGGSKSPWVAFEDFTEFGGHQLAQGIGGVVAAHAHFVGVHFEDVLGAEGVVLEGGVVELGAWRARRNIER